MDFFTVWQESQSKRKKKKKKRSKLVFFMLATFLRRFQRPDKLVYMLKKMWKHLAVENIQNTAQVELNTFQIFPAFHWNYAQVGVGQGHRSNCPNSNCLIIICEYMCEQPSFILTAVRNRRSSRFTLNQFYRLLYIYSDNLQHLWFMETCGTFDMQTSTAESTLRTYRGKCWGNSEICEEENS